MIQIHGYKRVSRETLSKTLEDAAKKGDLRDVDLASMAGVSVPTIRNYRYYGISSNKNLIALAVALGYSLIVLQSEKETAYFLKLK